MAKKNENLQAAAAAGVENFERPAGCWRMKDGKLVPDMEDEVTRIRVNGSSIQEVSDVNE